LRISNPVATKSIETVRFTAASAVLCSHSGPWISAQKPPTARRTAVAFAQK
jgi:hypothetical protein